MEIMDIITRVVEISKKGAEFNDEIAQLSFSMTSLKQAYEDLSQAEESYLSDDQLKALKGLLEQASEIMQKVSNKSNNLWRSLKSLWPGNELEQIKDIDNKIQRTVQMMQFSMSAKKCPKKRTMRDREADNNAAGPTLDMQMIAPTALLNPSPQDEAFYVEMLCQDKATRLLGKKKNLDKIFATWDKPKLAITRMMFKDFPPEITLYISKEHCVITARKEVEKVKIQKNRHKSKQLNQAMIEPTLNMNALNLNENAVKQSHSNSRERIKKGKSKIPSSNNSSNHGSKNLEKKKRSNPSIKVNGQKILDSDLEEKKQIKAKNFLGVKGKDQDLSLRSSNSSYSQYLSVNKIKVVNKQVQMSKSRRKLNDSEEIKEEEHRNIQESNNSLSDLDNSQENQDKNDSNSKIPDSIDFFYTCNDDAFEKVKLNVCDIEISSQSDDSDSESEYEEIVKGYVYEIEDLSTNGTYLQGSKLGKGNKKEIKDGDEIGIIVFIEENGKQTVRLSYKFRDCK
eukprot:403372500